jgi:hypothetical protein
VSILQGAMAPTYRAGPVVKGLLRREADFRERGDDEDSFIHRLQRHPSGRSRCSSFVLMDK